MSYRRASWSVPVGQITDDEALHALDEAWVAFHLAYARTSFGRLHEEDDCLWYESAIGFPVFGGVVRPRFTPADADRRVRELLGTLRGQPHHWFVMPTSQPPDLADTILGAGGEQVVALRGMVMSLEELAPAPALPPGVEIRPAIEDDAVRAYARLYAQLFEAPMGSWVDNLADAEVEIRHSAGDPFHRYLVVEQGRPIAAGMTCREGELASLETLSTVPEYRNRGIGAALAVRALRDERESGARIAAVWSSPGAQRLYARLGFRPVCTGYVFTV
jgi:GNAT superfamily N-acetyltransferase